MKNVSYSYPSGQDPPNEVINEKFVDFSTSIWDDNRLRWHTYSVSALHWLRPTIRWTWSPMISSANWSYDDECPPRIWLLQCANPPIYPMGIMVLCDNHRAIRADMAIMLLLLSATFRVPTCFGRKRKFATRSPGAWSLDGRTTCWWLVRNVTCSREHDRNKDNRRTGNNGNPYIRRVARTISGVLYTFTVRWSASPIAVVHNLIVDNNILQQQFNMGSSSYTLLMILSAPPAINITGPSPWGRWLWCLDAVAILVGAFNINKLYTRTLMVDDEDTVTKNYNNYY